MPGDPVRPALAGVQHALPSAYTHRHADTDGDDHTDAYSHRDTDQYFYANDYTHVHARAYIDTSTAYTCPNIIFFQ